MDELTNRKANPFFETLRNQYEELDRQLPELRRRVDEMSLFERLFKGSGIVKLVERVEVELQEEALRARLEAMQLARVTALNEQQIRLRALLGIAEAESSAHLVAEATQIYNNLLNRLRQLNFELIKSFDAHLGELDEIRDQELRKRHRQKFDMLLDEQDKMLRALIESTTQAIERIRQAYAERSPIKR